MARLFGCVGGLVLLAAAGVGGFIAADALHGEYTPAEVFPLPHHVPPTRDGASFRFGMAHDVLHERYPKHGPAFYTERNRLAGERLKVLPPDSDEAFALTDDIAAGLTRLGRPADAVPLLREKLKSQENRGLTGRDLYTTYANLGTCLYFADMGKAMRGDAAAKAACEEGVTFVERSVAVNPDSHFGREKWQIVILRFLLDAADRPDLLHERDFIGDRLDRAFTAEQMGSARPYQVGALMMGAEYITKDRRWVTRIGYEEAATEAKPKDDESVPFDEPMLGIIGMWRQGGGANPHFALCIGEVMLRVGQRYIAWAAFERAARMADRYWPDPAKQQFLRDHCGKRQKQIEETLPAGEVPGLRPAFAAELAFGEKYQREYQEYEAGKIAAGASIHDEHFWDEFNATHPPISTPPGPEEYLVTHRYDYAGPKVAGAGGAVFGAGLVAFVLAAWPRRKRL